MRVGFIGVSHWHAPIYYRPTARLAGVRIVAVSDEQEALATQVGSALGAKPYRDYRDLVLESRERIYEKYGRSRVAAYWSVLVALANFRTRLRAIVTVDGEVHRFKTPMIFMAANPFQLELFSLAGADEIRAGKLVALVAPDVGRWGLIAFAIRLAMGGMHHGNRTLTLHTRLRYFDPVKRRPGLPADVAALVEQLTADRTVVTLVNVSPLSERRVIVQGGAYGEHRFIAASGDGQKVDVNGTHLEVRLAPGSGAKIELATQRYANAPTLAWPW